jgi:hypothetical protein
MSDIPRMTGKRVRRANAPRRAPAVLGIAALCLTVAGCATPRAVATNDRQAVIDRIVASTTKVMVVAAIARRGSSDALDLALLRVPGIAVPPASLPESTDQVRLGEEILLVGFPWGKRLGLFSGIVSQMPTDGREEATADEGTDPTIVVDAASSKGVSGGGVFREATGTLIGIVEGYQTASIAVKDHSSAYSIKVPMSGETFVVPLARIRRFLQESGLDGIPGQ